jgi:hypothetical protein
VDWDSRIGTNYVRISLTTIVRGMHTVPNRSGLNWGQREGRNHDQAYLALRKSDQTSGFFPEVGVCFIVECDDGALLKMVRAQQNGKALETPEDNSILGAYFRGRLGVRSGDRVSLRHLLDYGRTTVDIFKTAQGYYFLDFRPS